MFTGISSNDTVIFMAGGNGSGKSTFCDGIRAYLGSDWVIDATLASLEAARNTMEEVFASGANAVIIHIIRDPEEAWKNGVLKRAAHGSHCTPRKVFEFTHKTVADNVATLEQEFARKGLQVYRIENK
jgi:predicted ABC-type ATPase